MGEQDHLVGGKGGQRVLQSLDRFRLPGVSGCRDAGLLEPLDALLGHLLGSLDGAVDVRHHQPRPGGERRGHHHHFGVPGVAADGAGQCLVGDGLGHQGENAFAHGSRVSARAGG